MFKREEDKIWNERITEAIASNNHHNLFLEVNKIKGRGNILPACVDDASSDN